MRWYEVIRKEFGDLESGCDLNNNKLELFMNWRIYSIYRIDKDFFTFFRERNGPHPREYIFEGSLKDLIKFVKSIK